FFCFFFQAEDGIRDRNVTGVQTCALPILADTTPYPIATVKSVVNGKSLELEGWDEKGKYYILSLPYLTGQPIKLHMEEIVKEPRSEERRVGKEGRSRWWENESKETKR